MKRTRQVIMMLLLAVSFFIPVKCLAASNANKAFQAYDQFLKAEQDDREDKGWDPGSFCIAYIDSDSVPELYYGNDLYTYKDGRIVSVTCADSAYPNNFVGYYEKTGVVWLCEGNAGGFSIYHEWNKNYYGILKNTQVQKAPVLTYYFFKSGSADADWDKIRPEVEEYKFNDQTISKSTFDNKLKQLSKGERLIRFDNNLHKNTEENRAKYLKAEKKSTVLKKMNAPSISSPKKKQIMVSWKGQSKVSGYRIQYSYEKSFKNAKTKKVSKGKTELTITGLESQKTCYVRIQTYVEKNGKTFYGKWSAVSKIEIK